MPGSQQLALVTLTSCIVNVRPNDIIELHCNLKACKCQGIIIIGDSYSLTTRRSALLYPVPDLLGFLQDVHFNQSVWHSTWHGVNRTAGQGCKLGYASIQSFINTQVSRGKCVKECGECFDFEYFTSPHDALSSREGLKEPSCLDIYFLSGFICHCG